MKIIVFSQRWYAWSENVDKSPQKVYENVENSFQNLNFLSSKCSKMQSKSLYLISTSRYRNATVVSMNRCKAFKKLMSINYLLFFARWFTEIPWNDWDSQLRISRNHYKKTSKAEREAEPRSQKCLNFEIHVTEPYCSKSTAENWRKSMPQTSCKDWSLQKFFRLSNTFLNTAK